MPNHLPLDPAFRAALGAVLLVSAAGCGGSAGADAEGGDAEYGAYFDEEQARVAVDPCALLTKEELSEQLFLSVSPSERGSWTSPEFDISSNEPELGTSRLCEYRFESRYAVGGGPVWHSDFNLTVFPSNAIGLAQDRREPIEGGTSGMFKERGSSTVYVVKGPHAVSIHGFPGRDEDEPGGEDAGRLALLRHVAERLP
jgi:hypothetical protein